MARCSLVEGQGDVEIGLSVCSTSTLDIGFHVLALCWMPGVLCCSAIFLLDSCGLVTETAPLVTGTVCCHKSHLA